MLLNLKLWLYISALKFYYGFSAISTALIYAQAKHETGNFNSKIFHENNNLFGMRQAKIRKNYATGTNRNHAIYKNLFDSVRDYFERQKNFRISNTNDSEFIASTVKSNYATDKKYKEKWLAVRQGVKPPFNFTVLLALFFFLLVAGYITNSGNNKNKNKNKN